MSDRVSDGIVLPNGVAISIPRPEAARTAYERYESWLWVEAVLSRGLRISNVPEEYRARVRAQLAEVVVESSVPLTSHDDRCPGAGKGDHP